MEKLVRALECSAEYTALVVKHLFDRRGRGVLRLAKSETRAVLVLPGFLGPRSVTRPLQMKFEKIGVPAFGFNLGLYSILTIPQILRAFRHRIERTRKMFPWLTRIDLVGHSMGGIIAAEAIEQGMMDGLETRLVGLGAPYRGTYAASVCPIIPGAFALLPFHKRYHDFGRLQRLRAIPFLSLAGGMDVLAPPARCDHPLAEHQVIPDADHAGLILRNDVFARISSFLARP